MTRKDYTTEASWREKIFIGVNQHGQSSLNDSLTYYGLEFLFNDAIKIHVYLDIVTSSPFSVFIALESSDNCSNYEVMSAFQCSNNCMLMECPFQYAEDEGHINNAQYCRYKCQITTKVYIRYTITRQMKYLPSSINIIELAAMAI